MAELLWILAPAAFTSSTSCDDEEGRENSLLLDLVVHHVSRVGLIIVPCWVTKKNKRNQQNNKNHDSETTRKEGSWCLLNTNTPTCFQIVCLQMNCIVLYMFGLHPSSQDYHSKSKTKYCGFCSHCSMTHLCELQAPTLCRISLCLKA